VTEHKEDPGIILFRRREATYYELLVLFLIAEAPTSGINGTAFFNALEFITDWQSSDGSANRVIPVLGPGFSGSTTSLEMALRKWFDENASRGYRVRLVSGSATNDRNKEILQSSLGERVSFHATVLPDNLVLLALYDFLLEKNPNLENGRLALLVESNTAYGRAFQQASQMKGNPPTDAVHRLQGDSLGAGPRGCPLVEMRGRVRSHANGSVS